MEDTLPTIRKASRVQGRTLSFRNAGISDATFILSLRTNAERSRYLSAVSPSLLEQEQWLAAYSEDSSQAYFVVEFQGQPVGTVRLYDAKQKSFCWGSWILNPGLPNHVSIESALMVYSYAIDSLGFESAHFDVRKGNENVWRFHERFGAIKVSESEADFFYLLDYAAIKKSMLKYTRFLGGAVRVHYL